MSEPVSSPVFEPRRAMVAAMASVATVKILIVLKGIAFVYGGSTSVLAALIDSAVDAAGSLMNLFAVHISLKPADNHHRYGHGKIEGLAALVQALLIAGSSMFLLVEAGKQLMHPEPIENPTLGIGVMIVSVILSVVLVMIQKASLKYAPSLAVESDRAHYGSDIIVNLAVLAALALQKFGAPAWIDPAVAFAIGLWLLRTAYMVAGKGTDMLLDREVSDEERHRIIHCVRSCADVKGLHDLRTRMVGMNLNISFDIEVDANLTLRAAHAIAHRVEARLMKDFPNAEIMIHVDPEGDIEDARHSEIGMRPVRED